MLTIPEIQASRLLLSKILGINVYMFDAFGIRFWTNDNSSISFPTDTGILHLTFQMKFRHNCSLIIIFRSNVGMAENSLNICFDIVLDD